MLSYWNYPTYTIGPVILQTWGTFVAVGILVALLVIRRAARRAGFLENKISDAALGILIAAFLGARLGHVFFYEWGYFRDHLSEIVKVWHGGFSSFGGFLGGVIMYLVIARSLDFSGRRSNPENQHKSLFHGIAASLTAFAPRNDLEKKLITTDIFLSGFPLGWTIGRIGCFFIHDHPGTLTHFILGVQYPDGVRHDLGLYDGLNTLGLAILLLFIGRRLEKRPGAASALIMIWYGTIRFLTDFLRAYDARYLGMTPAQYGSVILVFLGAYFSMIKFQNPHFK